MEIIVLEKYAVYFGFSPFTRNTFHPTTKRNKQLNAVRTSCNIGIISVIFKSLLAVVLWMKETSRMNSG